VEHKAYTLQEESIGVCEYFRGGMVAEFTGTDGEEAPQLAQESYVIG